MSRAFWQEGPLVPPECLPVRGMHKEARANSCPAGGVAHQWAQRMAQWTGWQGKTSNVNTQYEQPQAPREEGAFAGEVAWIGPDKEGEGGRGPGPWWDSRED